VLIWSPYFLGVLVVCDIKPLTFNFDGCMVGAPEAVMNQEFLLTAHLLKSLILRGVEKEQEFKVRAAAGDFENSMRRCVELWESFREWLPDSLIALSLRACVDPNKSEGSGKES
jgi:hypothetical protein